MRHVRAKGAPAHHVPRRSVLRVHIFLDRIRDVVFTFELLYGLDRVILDVIRHALRHLNRLDRGLRVPGLQIRISVELELRTSPNFRTSFFVEIANFTELSGK